MAHLNANAREWRPTSDLTTFELPASTSTQHEDEPNPLTDEATRQANTQPASSPLPPQTDLEEPPPYYPSFARATLADTEGSEDLQGINWTEEFERVMTLTRELIEKQLAEKTGEETTPIMTAMATTTSASTPSNGEAKPNHTPNSEQSPQRKSTVKSHTSVSLDTNEYPSLPGGTTLRTPAVNSRWTSAAAMLKSKAKETVSHTHNTPTPVPMPPPAQEFDENGKLLPPLTAKGNRRWKKPTKAQQKRELAQKNAFEAFANALLYSVSPFMAPLREKCKTSLPHIKVDQRFGKSGQPQSAVAQFIVAPLVTNYRPRHFHDITPGDLMEFHYDFAQVLKQLKSANEIHIGYGPVWKRYAVPYCYVNCKEYRQEVLSLCQDEIPNMRVEPIYEDDVVKDITDVILSVEELESLQNMSIIQAMSRRVNLAPLFDALDAVFQPIENYRIVIRDLHKAPSTFLLHTSQHEIEQKPSPLILYNDPRLWYDLPNVSRVRVEQTTAVGGHPSNSSSAAVGSSTSLSKRGEDDNKTEDISTYANGNHNAGLGRSTRRRDKDAESISTSLTVVAPVLGSLVCIALTVFLVWKKKKIH